MSEWLIIGVVVVATAAIIIHNEWRYRRLRDWVDAIGEMIGDWIDKEQGR